MFTRKLRGEYAFLFYKNCLFKTIDSAGLLFAKFTVSKDMQHSRALSAPPCPGNLYGLPPHLVDTDSFHALPQANKANIAVF